MSGALSWSIDDFKSYDRYDVRDVTIMKRDDVQARERVEVKVDKVLRTVEGEGFMYKNLGPVTPRGPTMAVVSKPALFGSSICLYFGL